MSVHDRAKELRNMAQDMMLVPSIPVSMLRELSLMIDELDTILIHTKGELWTV